MKIRNDAEVRLKVTADAGDSKKSIDDLNSKAKETPKHFDTIKNVGAKAFKATAVAVTTTATALGGLVMKSVKMAGELEQNVGGAEAVFKELGNSIDEMTMKTRIYNKETGKMEESMSNLKDVSLNAYKNMGLSQSDYLATVNKMGSLMQGTGMDTQKSLQLSSEAMQRAADVASVMGIDVNAAMESIAGAAKGNFTMMDNLGVAMNDTTLNAYALSKGINKSTSEMTNAEKVELAMQMFLEKTQKMAGNYAKENETFAGSFQTLKASVSNFLSGAGDIEPVIDSLMSFSNILIKSIGEMAPKIVDGIIGLINGIIPQLSPLLQKLLPVVIQGAVDLIQGLVKALPSLIPVLMDGIVQALKGISAILPELIQGLITGTIMIMQALADEMPTLLPIIIDALLQIIPILIDNLPLFLNVGGNLILGILKGMLNSIPKLLSRIPGFVNSIIKAFCNYFGIHSPSTVFAGIGGNLVKGLWNGISNVKNWILDKIKGFGKSILNSIKGIFGVHSPSTEFAWIGKMNMIGLEEGMEDMKDEVHGTMEDTVGLDFLKNGSVSVSSNYGSIATPNVQNQNIISVEANMDVNKFGQVFVKEIKTFSGGSKQSYNY